MGAAPDKVGLDLTSCDREPIHLPGSIQDTGFLVAVDGDWAIRTVSDNVARFLGVEPASLLGRRLAEFVGADLLHDLRGQLQIISGDEQVERLFARPIRPQGELFDWAVHYSGDLIVIEGEPTGEDRGFDAMAAVKGMMSRLARLERRDDPYETAARQLRAMLGFARVMVYRFEPDQSGVVIAESAQAGFGAFMGQHFPASDIPAQARALYARNPIRLIADVDGPISALLAGADRDAPLDLSFSTLRSVSPIHIEYLRNMGVTASLSVSIMRRNKLWGLFACHHSAPKPLSFQRRSAAELFSQLFSLQMESRDEGESRAYENGVRQQQERVLAALSGGGDLVESLAGVAEQIEALIPCDGLAICVGDVTRLRGRTPTREELIGLRRFLNRAGSGQVFCSSELGRDYPPAADFPERGAGLVAIPISRMSRDYLLFFRTELPQQVTWAGNPHKAAHFGPHGVRLTPRKSFEAWREVVHGQSAPWSAFDTQIAESLRVTLLEVIVRMSGEAANQRRSDSARQDLLIAELNHRVRNILGLIRALVAQSRESAHSLEHFVQVLSDRIFALAQAHDLLTADQWQPIPLRTLLRRELDAYKSDRHGQVHLDGPPVLVLPQAFSVLALVLHELTTNSAKYGALSVRHGTLDIGWSLDGQDALVIRWSERGGPPVKPPQRLGFGSTIIERSIPYELEGEAEIRYLVGGLQACFVVPARHVEPGGPEVEIEAPAPVSTTPTTFSGRALVVEDNALIAFDAEQMLIRLGFGPVEVCNGVDQAIAFLRATPDVRLALLDMNLGSTTSLPVALEAQRHGTRILFASGYGEKLSLPPELLDAKAVSKPFREETVAQAAAQLLGLTG